MSKGQHSVARLFESGGLQLSKTSEHNYQWTEDNKKKLMDQSQPIVMAFVKVTGIQPKIKLNPTKKERSLPHAPNNFSQLFDTNKCTHPSRTLTVLRILMGILLIESESLHSFLLCDFNLK